MHSNRVSCRLRLSNVQQTFDVRISYASNIQVLSHETNVWSLEQPKPIATAMTCSENALYLISLRLKL